MRAVLVLVLGSVLAACVGVGGGETPTGETRIDMKDNFYSRDVTRVPVGGTITFRNQGRAVHNAVAVDESFSTIDSYGEDGMPTDAETTITATEPGVHLFYCTFHATPEGEGMAATLVVGDVEYYPQGETSDLEPVSDPTGVTRRVPQDHETIQDAVDAADPGDLVLIGPGTYREQVDVTTPSLVLRGTDRSTVVIDGEFERPNGVNITADGVAVENLTVRNAVQNGLFWTSVTGYRASYVTSINNAVYGIYAFDATDGLFEHSYASGSADAGFYIGQCEPCRAVITDVIAEYNALGYSGTNASEELQIVNSTWRHNVAGIAPNTLDSELLPPVHDVDVVGNTVVDNGRRDVPVLGIEWPTLGNGIIVAGGENVRVERNRLVNNAAHGVLVTPNLSQNFWFSSGTEVRDNAISGSGIADVGLAGPSGTGNCFEGNDATTSIPPGLFEVLQCEGPHLPLGGSISITALSAGRVAEANTGGLPDNAVEDGPEPPPQPQMPAAETAPAQPAMDVYEAARVDLDAIELPAAPDDEIRDRELLMAGLPLAAASPWGLFFGFYLYVLPGILLAAWVALALWDLARREDTSRAMTVLWVLVVLLVPIVGVVAYLLFARSAMPRWFRLTVVLGGLAALALVLGAGALAGGVV